MVLGQGDMGQLGLGEDVMERKKPSPVGGDLEGKSVIQVICGGMHTVALTEDGKVGVREEGNVEGGVEYRRDDGTERGWGDGAWVGGTARVGGMERGWEGRSKGGGGGGGGKGGERSGKGRYH